MTDSNSITTMNMIGKIQTLLPSSTFRWPKGITLRALNEVSTIALPKELFGNENIGSIIITDDKADFILTQNESNLVFIKLKKGMSATLTKSSEAILIPNFSGDYEPKKFEVSKHTDY